ncbi:phage tail assembly protein [Xanthomonas arboricola]|uniref:Phage tail assembly protein n=4 Tax=Xanthomonas arboricola pv. pruni TaxID=69929 RepID=A0AAP4NJF5_9XANT|nr:phage tail assembly protein [Xanthomonas arboricola]GAE48578.1 phage-related tail protein [Xanthomonas arboricola pv. pruni str. MAFF 311562]GAE56018.1 phage-related tail protein [Xanthomonas arboricola pv. pruni MAFF 301420]MDN0268393.1 phage tail assembly protein [Xanthomonas arboricola pv. pruni]MDN0270374.1 phage tail assembly protein [Xanthomonas arboricola pv. pruni]MDN0274679.1 phage tail assembly protein [Xanthomonas arboricola pv. pruni]
MTPTFSPAIPLDQPITRGEQTITDLKVRKPGAGELRGLKLVDVLQMDITALTTLLPRISSPTLTTADINALDPADLLAVGQEVALFFLPKAQRETDSPTA